MAKTKSRFAVLADRLVRQYKYKPADGSDVITKDGWTPHNIKSILFMKEHARVTYYCSSLKKADGHKLEYTRDIVYSRDNTIPTFIGSAVDETGNKRAGDDARDDLCAVIHDLKGVSANMSNIRSLVFLIGGQDGLQLPSEVHGVPAMLKYLGIDGLRDAVSGNRHFGAINVVLLDGSRVGNIAKVYQDTTSQITKNWEERLAFYKKYQVTSVKLCKIVDKDTGTVTGYSRAHSYSDKANIVDVTLSDLQTDYIAKYDIPSCWADMKLNGAVIENLSPEVTETKWFFNRGNYPVDAELYTKTQERQLRLEAALSVADADVAYKKKSVERTLLDENDLEALNSCHNTLAMIAAAVRDKNNVVADYAWDATISALLKDTKGDTEATQLKNNLADLFTKATAKRFEVASAGAQEDFIKPTGVEVKVACLWAMKRIQYSYPSGEASNTIVRSVPKIFDDNMPADAKTIIEKYTASQKVNIFCNFVTVIAGIMAMQTSLASLQMAKYDCDPELIDMCAGTVLHRYNIKAAVNDMDIKFLTALYGTILNKVYGDNYYDANMATRLFEKNAFEVYNSDNLTSDMRVFRQNAKLAEAIYKAGKKVG